MDTETLLRDRFKVIADYPGAVYPVGEILHVFKNVEEVDRYSGSAKITPVLNDYGQWDKYPALFRKLQWWEERTIEQLESVKFVRIETYRGYWRVGDIVPVKKFVYGSLDKAQPTGYLLEGNHYQPIFELIPEYQKQPQKP